MKAFTILGYAYQAALHCEDCTPEDDSGCECGRTDHHPRCGPVFACAVEDDSDVCDDCGQPLLAR